MTADWPPAEEAWRIVAARLAAADRENAELRGEVERLQRRLFPSQGESYDNEVERQRVVIDTMRDAIASRTAERDDLRAQLAAAQAQLAEALSNDETRHKILETNREMRKAAEARLEAVREIAAKAAATLRVNDPFCVGMDIADDLRAALSAAPQPEPERQAVRAVREPARCPHGMANVSHAWGRRLDGVVGWNCISLNPEPPASDEPATPPPNPAMASKKRGPR